MAKKFDIRVCDIDSNGNKKWHEEPGRMANSAQELVSIYKMCGQEIQILHEYTDDESKNYGHQEMLDPSKVQMNTGYGGTGLMKVSEEDQKKIDDLINNKNQTQVQTAVQDVIPSQANRTVQTKVNQSPKFFTVGGIKCKMENGKLYQKQWIKLSEEECNEVRIVSDKNNKICNLKDKHIEVLKWVITENSDGEAVSENQDKVLING